MLYQRRTFTLPATNPGQSQKDWDRAFMSAEAFIAKYGESPDGQYEFYNAGPVSVPDATGCSA